MFAGADKSFKLTLANVPSKIFECTLEKVPHERVLPFKEKLTYPGKCLDTYIAINSLKSGNSQTVTYDKTGELFKQYIFFCINF